MRYVAIVCLLTIMGMPIGCVAGAHLAGREAARMRQRHPDRYVCGLFVLPNMFFGSFLGGLTFGVVGIAAARFMNRRDWQRNTAQRADDCSLTGEELLVHRSPMDKGNPYAAPQHHVVMATETSHRFVGKRIVQAAWLCAFGSWVLATASFPWQSSTPAVLCTFVAVGLTVGYCAFAFRYPSGPLDDPTARAKQK